MFRRHSASLVVGLSVLVLVTGCAASPGGTGFPTTASPSEPSPSEPTATSTPPQTEADEQPAPRTAAETARLLADVDVLLAEVGVVGERDGVAALSATPVHQGDGVSDEFAATASELLRTWYISASLDPEVLNAPDIEAAVARSYDNLAVLPDLRSKVEAMGGKERALNTMTTWMDDTRPIGDDIPTYAQFESLTGPVGDVPASWMWLRATSIYPVELPDGEAGLIMASRQLGVWSPEGVDDVKADLGFASYLQVAGTDICVYARDLARSPDDDPFAQDEARALARMAVDGTLQTENGWTNYDSDISGVCP